jgi:very-short-patch-repair endonuclease
LGFQVKRLWEHEILEAPDDAVSKVEHLLSEVPAAHSGARTSRRQPNTGMSS